MKLLAGGVRISSTSEKDGEREGRLRSRFEMVGGVGKRRCDYDAPCVVAPMGKGKFLG